MKKLLPIDMYQNWYNVFIEDDVDAYEKCDKTEKSQLINGKFVYDTLTVDQALAMLNTKELLQLTYPLTVAACYGSSRILLRLLQDDVIWSVQERNKLNVIHCIIFAAYHKMADEKQLLECFKVLCKNKELIQQLLLQENQQGLRPLEMAASLGLLTFVRLILNTPDVYLTRQVTKGHVTYKWYDITEYESYEQNNRRHISPIVFLHNMQIEDLEKQDTKDVFEWQVICQWINNKVYCNMPLVVIWVLLRLLFLIAAFILDILEAEGVTEAPSAQLPIQVQQGANFSRTKCKTFYELSANKDIINAFQTLVVVVAVLFVVFDCAEFIVSRFTDKTSLAIKAYGKKHKSYVVHTTFFRSFHFIFCLAVIGFFTVEVYQKLRGVNFSISAFYLLASWSVLYFVQILPNIGYLVVILERLLDDTIQIMVIYVIFFLPFLHVFLRVHQRNNLCEVIRMDNFPYAMYDVFLVLLNMVTFQEGINVQFNEEIYFSHVVYIILIATILMNLIIAIYSDTVATLAPHRRIIMQLQKLEVMLLLEKRLGSILSSYYKFIKTKCYVMEDGRMYLVEMKHVKSDKHVPSTF